MTDKYQKALDALRASARTKHVIPGGPCLCSQCAFVKLRDDALHAYAATTPKPTTPAASGVAAEARERYEAWADSKGNWRADNIYNFGWRAWLAALATTQPDPSASGEDAQAVERAARICDEMGRYECAFAIRRALRPNPTQEGGQAMPSDPSAIPAAVSREPEDGVELGINGSRCGTRGTSGS